MANGNNLEWTTEQMIENSANWSLAGDVALLNRLKNISDYLFQETVSLNSNVNVLLDNLETVGLKLSLTKNEFQSLRNTQFIENRVYEDDETLDQANIESEEKQLTEEEKEQIIKEAIGKGLNIMNKYFDKVEVAISDSEDDENDKSYVLQPKDLYADRPLPYLVGTQQWFKKWHVGLLPSESESESEKEQEIYSTSSSEDELPKDHILGSETSSELESPSQNTGPAANSTFNDSKSTKNMFHSSDESCGQGNSLPTKAPISNEAFAEQLAAKLDVVSKNENINTNPIKKISQPTKYGNLFSDEPPPLSDSDDTILPKSAQEGLFSKSLFDSNNEFNNSFTTSENNSSNQFIKTTERKFSLFNNSSSSEEDISILADKRRTNSVKPFSQPYKTSLPLDEPPEFDSNIKDPELFNSTTTNLSNTKFLKKTSLFDELPDDKVTSKNKTIEIRSSDIKKQPEQKPNSKKLSLFDDIDDDDDFLPSMKNKAHLDNTGEKAKFSLFDEDLDEKDDLFEGKPRDIGKPHDVNKVIDEQPKPAKKPALFDEDEDDDFLNDVDFFRNVPKKNFTTLLEDEQHSGDLSASLNKNVQKTEKKSIKSLFDDLEDSDSNDMFFKDTNNSEGVKKANDGNITKGLFKDLEEDSETYGDRLFDKSSEKANLEVNKNLLSSKIDKNILQHDKENSTKKISPSYSGINQQGVSKNSEKEINKNEKQKVKISGKNEYQDAHLNINEEDKSLYKEFSKTKNLKESVMKTEKESIKSEVHKNLSLFDDDDNELADEDIFDVEKKITKQIGSSSKTPSVLLKTNKELYTPVVKDNVGKVTESIESINKRENEIIFKSEEAQETSKLEEKQDKDNLFDIKNSDTKPEIRAIDSKRTGISTPNESTSLMFPNNINLFDPTPPPDPEWDNRSENSTESDTFSLNDAVLDHMSYHNSQQRSDLFDNNPPSLDVNDMNYSSGIVRDLNVTRVATIDSFFHPQASSSRRLSSDIFNEQQSQDSFFVTKNQPDGTSHGSSLERIMEHTESASSKIDYLTPSGNLEDLDSDSVFEKSMNSSKINEKMDKKISALIGIEDVKGNISTHKDQTSSDDNQNICVPEKDNQLLNQDSSDDKPSTAENKRLPGKLKINPLINVQALIPGAVPPRRIAKSASLDETDKTAQSTSPTNISAPLITHIEKSISFGSEKEFDKLRYTEVLSNVTKDRVRIPVKRRPSTRRARQEAVRKSLIDVELDQDNVKDNEQKTLEKSSNNQEKSEQSRENAKELNFNNDTSIKDEKQYVSSNIEPKDETNPSPRQVSSIFNEDITEEGKMLETEKNTSSKPLSKYTVHNSDDSLFSNNTSKNQGHQSKNVFEDSFESETSIFATKIKTDTSSINTTSDVKKTNIFGDDSSSNDEDLFSSVPTFSKKGHVHSSDKSEEHSGTTKAKLSLFSDKSDSDSDSELFGGKRKVSTFVEKKANSQIKKSNLFNDSDDSQSDSDLFGSKTLKSNLGTGNSDTKKDSNTSKQIKSVKIAPLKKRENKEVTDFDPLSAL